MRQIRDFFLWVFRPLLIWVSGKRLPYTKKKVTGADYHAVLALVRPGDVFGSITKGEFSTAVEPGKWKHSAIYSANPNTGLPCVIEAEGQGVIETDLVTFLMSKDDFVLVRPPVPMEIGVLAARVARSQLGMAYDYDFEFKRGRQFKFYCSELVWWAYDYVCRNGPVAMPFKPHAVLGVDTMAPDDIVAQCSVLYKAGTAA